MIGIGIRFDLGRYHATPWGANVNDATVEWPPSPWRLVRALYSTARTHTGLAARQPAIDRVLQTLIRGGPPSFRIPAALPAHSRHYMPRTSWSVAAAGNTTKVLDGFLAVDPSATLEVWWNVSLQDEDRAALDALVRALPYLGRSESICSASLLTDRADGKFNAEPLAAANAEPGDLEVIDLLCIDVDQPLDVVSVSVTELRRRRRRLPPGTRRVPYAVRLPDPAPRRRPRSVQLAVRPQLAMFRLGGSDRPAITEAVMVGQALRRALQGRYGEANGRAASPTFSGRNGDAPREHQHQHAHYLALPELRSPRIGRLLVWAPEGFGPRELDALERVTYLKLPGYPERTPCALVAVGDRSTLRSLRVVGRARRWRSLTPFGLVRHPKRRGGRLVDSPADQVLAELRYRELPEPEAVRVVAGSWQSPLNRSGPTAGGFEVGQRIPWHLFRSAKVGGSRLERTRLYGVELQFAEEVDGPIAIGALCHFGLGLMEPVVH